MVDVLGVWNSGKELTLDELAELGPMQEALGGVVIKDEGITYSWIISTLKGRADRHTYKPLVRYRIEPHLYEFYKVKE